MHKLVKKETKDGKRQKARRKCWSDALRKNGDEEDDEAEQRRIRPEEATAMAAAAAGA